MSRVLTANQSALAQQQRTSGLGSIERELGRRGRALFGPSIQICPKRNLVLRTNKISFPAMTKTKQDNQYRTRAAEAGARSNWINSDRSSIILLDRIFIIVIG